MLPFFTNLNRLPRAIRNLMVPLFILFSSVNAIAQNCFINPRISKITADISWAIKSYMRYVPYDWNTNPTKKYPLLIYLGGTGEMFQQPGGSTNDLCPVLQYSMPWRMNVGQFPDIVLDPLTGQQYSYLVVMPFVTAWNQQYSVDPGAVIDHMLQAYPNRIDVNRIYLTGMSRGTDNVMGYATSSLASASRLAAIVPVANCFPDHTGHGNMQLYNQQVTNLSNGDVRIWGIQCDNDEICPESYMQNWVNSVNSQRPGNALFSFATMACEGPDSSFHYAWNHAYDPEYRAAPGNKNIYEWMIQFARNSVLSVRMRHWDAWLQDDKVQLEWITTQENNTKEFIVQKATASGVFTDLFTVPAAGTSANDRKYTRVDENPAVGENLYRLVMRTRDNREEIFPVKRIVIHEKLIESVIIPNPVENKLISVYLNLQQDQRISIRLYDIYGRMIRQQDKELPPGTSIHTINASGLQTGMYLVQVIGTELRTVKKILIGQN